MSFIFNERIDVHSHVLPPFYRDALVNATGGVSDGMPVPEWSEENHLALMKKINATKCIISISSPGTHLTPGDDGAGRILTRKCNDYAADFAARHSDKIGFWASLPLPDVEGTLEEIEHVVDTLHADGFALESSHHGIYLGNPAMIRVFDELERRRATVFIHPTTPCIRKPNEPHKTTVFASPLTAQYPEPMLEFFFDTARSVADLLLSGTVARCPNMTFIIPHAGGALPPLIDRIVGFSRLPNVGKTSISLETIKETLSTQFYFDLAGMPFPHQIDGLLHFVKTDRLLYGSDSTFTPDDVVIMLAVKMSMEMGKIWDRETIRNVLSDNAKALLAKGASRGYGNTAIASSDATISLQSASATLYRLKYILAALFVLATQRRKS